VLYPDRRLDYYAAARWGSTSGQVMQSLLVASLQNSRAFRSVTAAPAGTAATHVIDIDLRDFQAEYAGENSLPTVRVSIVANVLRVSDRRLLAVVPAAATVAAGENRLTAVVLAFETAAQQVAAVLGRETAAALAADRASAQRDR
jgi:cholesterol transport system auxiliary component